jgi:hypothetical protein
MIIAAVITRLRSLPVFVLAVACVAGPASASDHVAPPASDATTYPAVEVHADEKVAIAADPYNTAEKAKIFRVDYLKYGFLPIRVIVTNNGDKPISLDEARIHFITAMGSKIPAAESTDVERRTTQASNVEKKIPLPAPLPPIHRKPGSKDKDIEADFNQFEYQALAVEAHTTRAGFLFYDVQGLSNPLKGAKLYLRKLKGADGKELFYFEIPFEKYLTVQPN